MTHCMTPQLCIIEEVITISLVLWNVACIMYCMSWRALILVDDLVPWLFTHSCRNAQDPIASNVCYTRSITTDFSGHTLHILVSTILTRQIWGIWKLRPACSPKRPIWVKIGDVLSRVTLKFDGWPWKTIGHLFFAVSSFVQHFIAIVEFKLELQSGNAQFESNLTISRAMWPWNLMDDLEKQ